MGELLIGRADRMFDGLFTYQSARSKQREAPLLLQREQYLSHIYHEGVSKERVRSVASMLLHIVRLMELNNLREVDASEIERACQRWLLDTESHKRRPVGPWSVDSFTNVAVKWLRFLNVLKQPTRVPDSVDILVEEFVHFLRTTRAMTADATCSVHGPQRPAFGAFRTSPIGMKW